MELFALIRHGCAVPPVHCMIATGNHLHFDSLRGAPLVRDDTVSFRLFSIDLPIASRTILTQFVRGAAGGYLGGGFSAAPPKPASYQCSCRDKNIAPGGICTKFSRKVEVHEQSFLWANEGIDAYEFYSGSRKYPGDCYTSLRAGSQ